MRRLLIIALIACCAGLGARSDEGTDKAGDKGFLVNFLESKLSGMGRAVTIDGFQGALSSRATFDRLQIADAGGVWISFEDGAISWSRSALLSGRVEIGELSARLIHLTRKPSAGGSGVEARSFSLPELPVSVSIGELRADQVVLGPEILGTPATVSILGKATLDAGAGQTSFELHRVDGQAGDLVLSGSYSNSTGQGTIDLLAKEGAGGIAATLLAVPGRPSAELALHGAGTAADFRTDLALTTDGAPRLTGSLTTGTPADAGGERQLALSLKGDIAPLLTEDYRAFFAGTSSLEAEGWRRGDGQLDLTRLVLASDGVDLTGRISLSPDRIPQAAALTIRLGLADNSALVLPVPGAATTARNGVLKLRYDAAKGQEWRLAGDLAGFARPGMTIGNLVLDGSGQVLQPKAGGGSAGQILGELRFDARGLALDDPALARAVGSDISGKTGFAWAEGAPLALQGLAVTAGDLGVTGDLRATTEGLDLAFDGALRLSAQDMARFSGLAGRPLGGRAEITVKGRALALSHGFDAAVDAAGTGLTVDQPMLDRLLAKGSTIHAVARRDEGGITLDGIDLIVSQLTAHGAGTISSAATDLRARVEFSDLSVLGSGLGGGLKAEATLAGLTGQRRFGLTGTGSGLRLGSATLDPLIAGPTEVSLQAAEGAAGFALVTAHVANPMVSADVGPSQRQAGAYDVAARLADIAPVLPGFSGPLAVSGDVAPDAGAYRLALKATGPGGIAATLSGTAASDLRSVDLGLSGQGQLALLNRRIAPRSLSGPVAFDLAMRGAPGLASLSGHVTANGARLSSPADALAFEGLTLSADLADGRANLSGSGHIRGGGSVRLAGPVGLAPPFDGALAIDLDHAVLRRPDLFRTTLSGSLSVDGPLFGGATIGGAVTLHEAEIVVAPPGSAPEVPAMRHMNDSAPVRTTRVRAGLGRDITGPQRQKVAYNLNLDVSAPARIFVRGRGLEAEMGGAVHLGGSTADVAPTGQFSLIRGRLSILGKRFVLDRGVVQLLGSLVPYLEFSALADTFGATTSILLDGPATKPEVHFTSSSGLPEEEVLSQLLFGDTLNDISAFQLVQLANAIATLRGGGGDGIITRLRTRAGLDDLDITADDKGSAGVKAGKYLSDKVYSEVSVGQDGKSKVEIDLDVSPDLSVRGTVGTDGQTGAGIFYSRDY